MTPLSLLTIIGVVFLFLAAFNVNFPRISSGWLGLALIYCAIILPGFGLSLNALILVIAALLIVVIVLLITGRLQFRPPVA